MQTSNSFDQLSDEMTNVYIEDITFDKNHDILSQITELFHNDMEKKFVKYFGDHSDNQNE